MGLIFLVIIIFFFSFDLYYNKIAFNVKIAIVLLFSFVALFAVFAFPDLPDIGGYKKIYENYHFRGRIDTHVDVGYFCLIRICSFFGFNFSSFRYFTILIFTLFFIYGILKYSSNLSLSLLFFFTCVFVVSFLIQVRVGFGLALVIGFGIPNYAKGRYFNFFLSTILASFFHISLIIILFPFLLSISLKTPKIKFILILGTFLLLRLNVIGVLLDYALMLGNVSYLAKIVSYINISTQTDALLSTRDFLSIIILLLTFKTSNGRIPNFMYWSYFCCFFFKLAFRNFPEMAVRFYLIFQYPLIFLMPMLYQKKNFIMRCFIIGFLVVNFIMMISNYGDGSIIGNANLF
jgi:hypothetical protein